MFQYIDGIDNGNPEKQCILASVPGTVSSCGHANGMPNRCSLCWHANGMSWHAKGDFGGEAPEEWGANKEL